MYLSLHLTNSTIDRSVIVVNAVLDVNKWAQIPVEDSSDVSAIQLHTPKSWLQQVGQSNSGLRGETRGQRVWKDNIHGNVIR